MNTIDRGDDAIAYINTYRAEHGCAPSVRELADHLGYQSPDGAHRLIKQLIRDGRLVQSPGVARSIRPPSIAGANMVDPGVAL